jgi:hypothetical protein
MSAGSLWPIECVKPSRAKRLSIWWYQPCSIQECQTRSVGQDVIPSGGNRFYQAFKERELFGREIHLFHVVLVRRVHDNSNIMNYGLG